MDFKDLIKSKKLWEKHRFINLIFFYIYVSFFFVQPKEDSKVIKGFFENEWKEITGKLA